MSDACRALRAAAAEIDPKDASQLAKLRRHWDQPLVHAAVELALARRSAIAKFPEHPEIVADPAGVEQASSALVASYKAKRIARTGIRHIHDLCCGIGGDSMSLQRITQVTAIDHNPLRAWMTAQNAGCESCVMDVQDLNMHDVSAFHLDPARRDRSGRRAWQYAQYQPGPDQIESLIAGCPNAAVKLGPGISIQSLPLHGRELEFISEHGRLVQAMMWSGTFAEHPDRHTATILPDQLSITGAPAHPPLGERGRYLHEADSSVERAQLLGPLCDQLDHNIVELHPGLGLLTSESLIESPWLRSYELIDIVPWRLRKVDDLLRTLDGGTVTIRTRGINENPDAIQHQLRSSGSTHHTLFITRFGEQRVAIITRPCS